MSFSGYEGAGNKLLQVREAAPTLKGKQASYGDLKAESHRPEQRYVNESGNNMHRIGKGKKKECENGSIGINGFWSAVEGREHVLKDEIL